MFRSPSSTLSQHKTGVIHLAVSLCLLFTAYNGVQTLSTSLQGATEGDDSLIAVYAGSAISFVFIGTPVVAIAWSYPPSIPSILLLPLSATLYLSFLIAQLNPTTSALVATGLAAGLGAGTLWTAQGVYVTRAAYNAARASRLPPSSLLGQFQGLFWGIFQLNLVLSNAVASLALVGGSSFSLVYALYTAIAAVATVSLFFLPPELPSARDPLAVSSTAGRSTNDGAAESSPLLPPPHTVHADASAPSLASLCTAVARLHTNPRLLLLVPLLFFCGLEQAFIYGEMSSVVSAHLGKRWLGVVFLGYGVTDAATAFVLGRLSDGGGGRWPLAGALALGTSTFIGIWHFGSTALLARTSTLVGTTCVWGAVDAIANTLPAVLLSHYFEADPAASYAAFQLHQALGFIGGFTVQRFAAQPLPALLLFLAIMLGLTMSSLLFLDQCVQSINVGAIEDEDDDVIVGDDGKVATVYETSSRRWAGQRGRRKVAGSSVGGHAREVTARRGAGSDDVEGGEEQDGEAAEVEAEVEVDDYMLA